MIKLRKNIEFIQNTRKVMEIICLLVKFYEYIFMEFYDNYGENFKYLGFLFDKLSSRGMSVIKSG